MKDTKQNRRHWIAKHALGECGVNTVLVKRKEKNSALCKRCGTEETTTHVWQCQTPEVHDIWITAVAKLDKWLHDIQTDPILIHHITISLLGWYHGTHINEHLAHDFATERTDIGWNLFIEGWISTAWRKQQTNYLLQIQSSKSSFQWATALIKKMWDIAWDLWEHRSGIEHLHDVQEQHQSLNEKIETEIDNFDSASGHAYDYMFENDEIKKLNNGTIGYKIAWLQNVHAAKIRAHRRSLRDSELQGMQRLMRNFLTSTT